MNKFNLMKKIFLLSFVALSIFSCKKDNNEVHYYVESDSNNGIIVSYNDENKNLITDTIADNMFVLRFEAKRGFDSFLSGETLTGDATIDCKISYEGDLVYSESGSGNLVTVIAEGVLK